MNFQKNTGKTIQEAFETYHKLNPNVFSYFEKYAFEAISTGKKKVSFKMILNAVRWQEYIRTSDPIIVTLNNKHHQFKINDAFSSRYSRLFIDKYPQYADKIELRGLRA